MNEPGAEKLYTIQISVPVVNFGVSVVSQSANSEIDPWVLGSKDENDVQGYAGIPVNVNGLMYDYRADIETAGAVFPLDEALLRLRRLRQRRRSPASRCPASTSSTPGSTTSRRRR